MPKRNSNFNFLKTCLIALVMTINCVSFAWAQAPAQTPAAQPAHAPNSDLQIDVGDLLEISVYGAPDFDKKDVRVSGSGEIVLPLIGAQRIKGLTVAQAEQLIASELAAGQFFNNPQVSILVKEYFTQGISVLGEVQKPGVYPLLGPRRLFDAISLAGGLTPKAGRFVTITHRDNPDHPDKLQFGDDVQASTASNVEVFPGDTVVISKAGIVYVIGDVRLPGGFVMEHGNITVLQALALAQGANPTASLNSARLIHSVGTDHQETPIQLKEILKAKAPDIKLQPDDILFVPNSVGKSAARRGLEAVLQTATGVAIYRP